jgi:hypothetical protein
MRPGLGANMTERTLGAMDGQPAQPYDPGNSVELRSCEIMPPRIFISHSAHEPAAQHLLESLANGLRKAGFVVLLDRERLAPGSRWRPELYT